MNNYENTPETYYDEVPAPGTSLTSNAGMGYSIAPIQAGDGNSRAHRQLARRADLSATSDRYQAQLAQSAIIHTTALSALADTAIAAVPSANEPVRGIVNVYARSAAERIARW